jgi:hypothetical protein
MTTRTGIATGGIRICDLRTNEGFSTAEARALPRGAKNQFAAFLQALAFNLKRLLVLEPSLVSA